jgi:predicted Zn-dependent peptidase
MLSRWIIGFLLLLSFAVTTFAQTSKVDSKITLPAYKRVKLSNGLTLLLMEQHEVPVISFSMRLNAGGVTDPAGKEGVAALTAEMLRKGTPTRNAQQIADQIDFVGGSPGWTRLLAMPNFSKKI